MTADSGTGTVLTKEESLIAATSAAKLYRARWQVAMFVQLAGIGIVFLCRAPIAHLLAGLQPSWLCMLSVGYVVLCIAAGIIWQRSKWVLGISNRQFAITTLLLLMAFGLLGTVIRQDPASGDFLSRIGLRTIFPNYPPFIMTILFLLLNLGVTTGRRLMLPCPGRISFLISHCGMLLLVLAMIGSSALSKSAYLELPEGEGASTALLPDGSTTPLSRRVDLVRFSIEKYPPRLAVVEFVADATASDTPRYQVREDQDWAAPGHQFTSDGFTVRVADVLSAAKPAQGEKWIASREIGTAAAYVRVVDNTQQPWEGWIAAGNDAVGIQPQYVQLDRLHLLTLMESPPKAFTSVLRIHQPGQAVRQQTLAVNAPVRVGQWLLYQNSYTVTPQQQTVSIIEAVYDPALPLVYLGLIIMCMGTIIHCWQRRRPSNTPSVEQSQTAEVLP